MAQKIQTLAIFALKLAVIAALSIAAAFSTKFFLAPPGNLLFRNSDFEAGNLRNWHPEGDAFSSQPTLGDNPTKREWKIPTQIQGSYWIGTYENRPDLKAKEGSIQKDAPTGRLISSNFKIRRKSIRFLASAGNGTPDTSISLSVDGKIVRTHSPNAFAAPGEVLKPVIWDVSPWVGQTATIIISDLSSTAWGHINADDFRYA